MSSSKRPGPNPILGVDVSRCSIGEVLGVVKMSKIGIQEFLISPDVRV